MMDNKAADARRDVLAYMRALVGRNGEDAKFIASQALLGDNAGEFVWQLSTFAQTAIEFVSELIGTTPDQFIARLQSSELTLQGGA